MVKRFRLSSPPVILSSKAFKEFHLNVFRHLFFRLFLSPSSSRPFLPLRASITCLTPPYFPYFLLSSFLSSSPFPSRLPCNLDLTKSGSCLSIAVIFTEPFFSLCKFGLPASCLPPTSILSSPFPPVPHPLGPPPFTP